MIATGRGRRRRRLAAVGVLVAAIGVIAVLLWRAAEAPGEPASAPKTPMPVPSANSGGLRMANSQRAPPGVSARPTPTEPSTAADASTSSAANASSAEDGRTQELRAWLETNARAAEKNVERYCEQSKASFKVKAFAPYCDLSWYRGGGMDGG